jgi:hypothetical protein
MWWDGGVARGGGARGVGEWGGALAGEISEEYREHINIYIYIYIYICTFQYQDYNGKES